MGDNEDIELSEGKSKPNAGNNSAISRKESNATEDRPPTPPKRLRKEDSESMVKEPEEKRRTGFFPRPEVIYKPENTESYMTCLKNLLIVFNLLIWLLGAALTGVGIWIKVDDEFWDIQTGLNMKQYTMAGYILIAAGVFIMVVGFLGCYGAFSLSLCMLVVYAVIVILIILLEIAVMALVWTLSNRKDFREEVKGTAKKAMQEMAKDEMQLYFLNLLQVKLRCCGVDSPDDYENGVPHSCTNPATAYPYEQGCLDAVVRYLKGKAAILGGVAIAVFILQLAALVMTLCLACAIKNSATNSIF